jgi:hypothetical protein
MLRSEGFGEMAHWDLGRARWPESGRGHPAMVAGLSWCRASICCSGSWGAGWCTVVRGRMDVPVVTVEGVHEPVEMAN